MRKISIKNLIIILIPIIIVLLLCIGMDLFAIKGKEEAITVDADTVFYDQYNQKYITSQQTVINESYNGQQSIDYEDQKIKLSNSKVAPVVNDNSATLLSDGVVVTEDNSFFNIYKGSLINGKADTYTIDQATVPNGTVIKTGDRQYIILGDVSVGDLHIEGIIDVFIDKAGNPTLYTKDDVYKYSEAKDIELNNGVIFKTGNEQLIYSDGSITDLTELGGSSSQYEDLNKSTDDQETLEEIKDEKNDTSNTSDEKIQSTPDSNQVDNDNVTTEKTDTKNTTTTDNQVNQDNSNSSSSGSEDIIITEDMYEDLFKKHVPTGLISSINNVTAISAEINASYSDLSGSLVTTPIIEIVDETGQVIFTQTIEESVVKIVGLQPNNKYTANLKVSYDLGSGIEQETIDSKEFSTESVQSNIVVELMKINSAIVNVSILDDIELDSANVMLEENNSGEYEEFIKIPLNTKLATSSFQTVEFIDLKAGTDYKVSITDAVYNNNELDVDGEYFFTTLEESSSFNSVEIDSDNNKVIIDLGIEGEYDYLEYNIYNKNDKLVTKRQSIDQHEDFGLENGLVSEGEYYAVVNLISDEQIVDQYTTPYTNYSIDFKIESITNKNNKYQIKFSGLPILLNNCSISVLMSVNNQDYNQIVKKEYIVGMDNKIEFTSNQFGDYYYKLKYVDSKGDELVTQEIKYSSIISDDYLYTDNYYYINKGSSIEKYDLESDQVIDEYKISILNEFIEIYNIGDVIFAIDEKKVMHIYNDVDNVYQELDEVEINDISKEEEELYVGIEKEIYKLNKNGIERL